MKTRFLIPALIVLSFGLFYSCNTEETEGGPTNYWDSNALTKLKLRGAVHTMTENDVVTTFNSDGNVTSIILTHPDQTNETTYLYENGKLVSETTTISTSNNISLRSSSTQTNYEYENVGKYVPNISNFDLVPALSAIITENNRVDCDFHGANLWMVYSSNGTPFDTIVVEYSGNLPSNFSSDNMYCNNITYASNGMFLSYNSGNTGPNYHSDALCTFVPSDTFLIGERIVMNSTYGSETTNKTTNYSYNEHLDLTEEATVITGSQTAESTFQWTDYVYDSAGNWISRIYHYSTGEANLSEYTQTRSFTYY